jgi:signal transduction histidine kinase
VRSPRVTGLRTRFIAGLAATSILTLAVAGLALVAPLDRRLRDQAARSLQSVAIAVRPSFDRAIDEEHPGPAIARAARLLRRRSGAEVVVMQGADRILYVTDPDGPHRFPAATAALAARRSLRTFVEVDGRPQAVVVLPLRTDERAAYSVIALRSLQEATAAGRVVRRALLVAAIIALLAALPLGFAIATGLVRRIGRLRRVALKVADLGPSVEFEPDRARDEVGELSRAFATMQARLREQEQARKTFVATASHELRTPLASLRLMLEGLRDDLTSEGLDIAGAREQAARAEVQASRLAGLADDLLELSRIDAGVASRREPVDMREVSRSVLAEFDARARERDIALQLSAPERVWALGDPGAVAQILRILLDNGLRFGPPGSPIELAVAGRDGRAQVSVCDSGPGIPESERERIFERFTHGESDDGHAGFGLGLAIGRELASGMGGALAAADAQRGARFVLELDRAPDSLT